MWWRGFNITLNNTGTQDLEGIKVDVKFLVNNAEKYVETWSSDTGANAEYPNMTCGLEAGETCEIMGGVVTTLDEWADPQVVEISFIAQVTVNGTVLDDLSLP
jgi:hypothetical protein